MPLIPIPDDWDGVSWCCYVVEWPSSVSWKAILNGQITAPLKGRFWDEKTGTITDAQAVGLQIFERNVLGGNMSCFEDLAASITYLADRLYSKPCCDGSVNLEVYQGKSAGGEQIYGTQTPSPSLGDPETDPPPEGFASWAAYETYKCQVANILADGVAGSLRNISYISLAGSTVGVATILAALAGFIVVPAVEIPILIGALFAAEGVTAACLAVAGWLETNRADVVCALYLAEDTETAVDDLIGLVDDALGALSVASSLHPFVRVIALVLVSTDTLNQLFDGSLEANYPDADCEGCAEGDCATDSVASMIESSGGGSITAISVVDNDTADVTIESEYFSGEDHERAGLALKSEYLDGVCGLYTNGFTYDSGPGTEANIDMVWTPPGGSATGDVNPDAVHFVEGVYWLQVTTVSPGTFVCTVRVQRNAPA